MVGGNDGSVVDVMLGTSVDRNEGSIDDTGLANAEGKWVGLNEGTLVGDLVTIVGGSDGTKLGVTVGANVGSAVGVTEGFIEGT